MRKPALSFFLVLLGLSLAAAPALAGKTRLITDTSTSAATVPFINAGPADDSTAATGLGVQVNGTEVMRVTASGNVGIGTTSPTVPLDVKNAIISAIRIENGDSSRKWDLLNGYGTNTDGIFSIFDRTAGAARLAINTSGYVGIGTTSPSNKLQIAAGSIWLDTGYIVNFGSGANIGSGDVSNSTSLYVRGGTIYFQNTAGTVNYCSIASGALGCGSDVNLKKNIEPITSALEKLTAIKGVSFEWRDAARGTKPQIGVIAQDVEKVFPALVSKDPQGYKMVNYGGLTAPLIEAVKELKAENDTLRAAFQGQEARLRRLEEERR